VGYYPAGGIIVITTSVRPPFGPGDDHIEPDPAEMAERYGATTTCRPLHREHTSRAPQSGTIESRHYTIRRPRDAAALPSVIGARCSDFTSGLFLDSKPS